MHAALGAHLMTVKTPVKYQILLEVMKVTTYQWIGLDDIQEEGTFRWDDDGSVVDDDWKKQIFRTGRLSLMLTGQNKSSPPGRFL